MKAFEPITIRNMQLKNRFVMPPMCMYSAFHKDGKVGPFHTAHYVARAIGQVGLVIVEATGILPEGRISDECLGIWEDAQVEGMKKLVQAIREQGAVPALQINHAGRKSVTTGIRKIAPSAIPFNEHEVTYEEMTEQDIHNVLKAYREAARRADEAGFMGLEIHAAHGYLINQFLSPLSNLRQDAYGQDKALFLHQAVEAVSSAWPKDKALWIRISATDWLEGGVTPEDWISWLGALPRSMDMVHVSSGGLQKSPIRPYPGYMLPLAEAIKKGTGLPVIGVGHLDDDQLVMQALEAGRCDLAAMGRELLRHPNKVCELAWRYHHPQLVTRQYERAYKERM